MAKGDKRPREVSMEKNIDLVERLFQAAFTPGRTPRSDAYKRGVKAILSLKTGGPRLMHTYVPGTAELDAWCAGCEEGRLIWRQHKTPVQKIYP